jgi:hypothetical protein
MKSRWVLPLILTLLAAGALARQQEGHAMSAEEKAAMEAMAAAAAPGDPHKALDSFVGTWDVEFSMWHAPGAEPVRLKGTSESRWILGGRWVEQRFRSEFMGEPFEGLGHVGYDNVKKKYVGSWMDTMSTWAMKSEGWQEASGRLVWKATTFDPMAGKEIEITDRTRLVNPDYFISEMWAPGPDGKEFKSMEFHYRRKK